MSVEAGNGKTEARKYNEAKLASLYEEYYDKIARYAYVHTGDRTEAEDIAGEVFLKALESLKSYKERGIPMQAWLFRIAHNLVVDHLRKMAKRKTVSIDTVQIVSDTNGYTIDHLKELILRTFVLKNGYKESLKEVDNILNKKVKPAKIKQSGIAGFKIKQYKKK